MFLASSGLRAALLTTRTTLSQVCRRRVSFAASRRLASHAPQQQHSTIKPVFCRRMSFSASGSSFDAGFETFQQELSEAGKGTEGTTPSTADGDQASQTVASASEDTGGESEAFTTPSSFLNSLSTDIDEQDSATDFRRAMEEEVKRIETQTAEYLAVLSKAAPARLAEEARDLLGKMRSLSLPVDVNAYNAAMTACMNDLAQFEQVRAEMRRDSVPVNAITLAVTAVVCERNKMLEEAFIVQRDLLSALTKIPAASRESRLAAAKATLVDFDVLPPVTLYHSLIAHALESGNHRRAYAYVREMSEQGVKLPFAMIELVVELCEEAGFHTEAEDIKELITHESVLAGESADAELAERLEQGLVDGKDRSNEVRAFYQQMAEL